MHKQLNITPLAAIFTAMIALVGMTGCNQASDTGTQCDDKACFSQHFSSCDAASYTTEKQAGAQARYRVLGLSDSQCRVEMQYMANPNSAWVDKPVSFVLDSNQPFEPQMQKALQTCLTEDAPGSYECSGPLRGIASESGQAVGNKQGPDSTTLLPGSAMAQLPAIADDAPTRFPVEIDGQWGYIDRQGNQIWPREEEK